MGNESDGNKDTQVTYSTEKDGTLVVKAADGTAIRFVKETDLLAVKGSKESAELKLKTFEEQGKAGGAAATDELESTRQKLLQAEAQVTSLKEQVSTVASSAAERDVARTALKTAEERSEELEKTLLELQRTLIVNTYGVPKATVEKKTLKELATFAEALTAVTGKPLGNYAVGGGAGGSNLSNQSPLELARLAYGSK